MIDFGQFHFLRPWWFLLLLPLFIFFLRTRSRPVLANAWSKVVDPHLLHYMVQHSKTQSSIFLPLLLLMSGLALVIALAGPTWQKLPQPVFKNQSARVFVLDLSQSMSAADVSPSRLARIKLKLMDMLRNSKEGQSALIVYAADAFVVSPLTDDAKTVMNLVPTLSTDLMPVQGSNPAGALLKARQLLSQAGIPGGEIILLGDGVNEEAFEVAANLADAGHRLHVLAVGTEQGAPISLESGGFLKDNQGNIVVPKLDSDGLKKLAGAGRGEYAELTVDDSDVQHLLKKGRQFDLEGEFAKSDRQFDLWRDEGYWLLLLVLPMALFAFRRGWLAVVLVGMLPLYPQDSWALSWDELWLNNDQRGQQLLDAKKYKEAAKTFSDKEWQADALYRAGEFEKAGALYKSLDGTDNRYNYANALARSSKLEDALSVYEEVLKQNPEHEDARANYDLIKNLLDQQQPNQKQNQDSQQGNQDSEKQNQESQDGEENDSQEQADQSQDQNRSGDSKENAAEQKQDQQQASRKDNPEDSKNKSPESQEQSEKTSEAEQDKQGNPVEQQTGATESQQELTAEQKEQQQALEQWLRRIPDDPGGLLRQKFLLQHRQQQQTNETVEPW